MRNATWVLGALVLSLAGCGEHQEQIDKVKEKAAETAAAAGELAASIRDALLEESQEALDSAKVQLAALREKAAAAGAESRAQIEKAIENLEARTAKAREKMDELKETSGEAFDDVSAGVKQSLAELQKSLAQAKSRFGDS